MSGLLLITVVWAALLAFYLFVGNLMDRARDGMRREEWPEPLAEPRNAGVELASGAGD